MRSSPQVHAGGAPHPELQELVNADQLDRQSLQGGPESFQKITERDRVRRARVAELLAQGAARTGNDFFAAALVFQHGDTLSDYARTRELAKEAARLGHPHGLWLTAAAWDRWLMSAGYPQRFGTQYRLDAASKQMKLYPIDTSVSDAERARWGFPPRAEVPERF